MTLGCDILRFRDGRGIFGGGFFDLDRAGERFSPSFAMHRDAAHSEDREPRWNTNTYTVRYWMGRAIPGSTSRRVRTLRMDKEPFERVRRRPPGRVGRAASSSPHRTRSAAGCLRSISEASSMAAAHDSACPSQGFGKKGAVGKKGSRKGSKVYCRESSEERHEAALLICIPLFLLPPHAPRRVLVVIHAAR